MIITSKQVWNIFEYIKMQILIRKFSSRLHENDIAKIKVHFRKLFFDKDEYDEFTHFNEVIQKRYNKKVENSFISVISKKRKKYFVQLSPKDPPSVLKNKILDFYFDANVLAGSNRNNKLSVIGNYQRKSIRTSKVYNYTNYIFHLQFKEQLKRALKWECHATAKKYFYNKPFAGTREEVNNYQYQAT